MLGAGEKLPLAFCGKSNLPERKLDGVSRDGQYGWSVKGKSLRVVSLAQTAGRVLSVHSLTKPNDHVEYFRYADCLYSASQESLFKLPSLVRVPVPNYGKLTAVGKVGDVYMFGYANGSLRLSDREDIPQGSEILRGNAITVISPSPNGAILGCKNGLVCMVDFSDGGVNVNQVIPASDREVIMIEACEKPGGFWMLLQAHSSIQFVWVDFESGETRESGVANVHANGTHGKLLYVAQAGRGCLATMWLERHGDHLQPFFHLFSPLAPFAVEPEPCHLEGDLSMIQDNVGKIFAAVPGVAQAKTDNEASFEFLAGALVFPQHAYDGTTGTLIQAFTYLSKDRNKQRSLDNGLSVLDGPNLHYDKWQHLDLLGDDCPRPSASVSFLNGPLSPTDMRAFEAYMEAFWVNKSLHVICQAVSAVDNNIDISEGRLPYVTTNLGPIENFARDKMTELFPANNMLPEDDVALSHLQQAVEHVEYVCQLKELFMALARRREQVEAAIRANSGQSATSTLTAAYREKHHKEMEEDLHYITCLAEFAQVQHFLRRHGRADRLLAERFVAMPIQVKQMREHHYNLNQAARDGGLTPDGVGPGSHCRPDLTASLIVANLYHEDEATMLMLDHMLHRYAREFGFKDSPILSEELDYRKFCILFLKLLQHGVKTGSQKTESGNTSVTEDAHLFTEAYTFMAYIFLLLKVPAKEAFIASFLTDAAYTCARLHCALDNAGLEARDEQNLYHLKDAVPVAAASGDLPFPRAAFVKLLLLWAAGPASQEKLSFVAAEASQALAEFVMATENLARPLAPEGSITSYISDNARSTLFPSLKDELVHPNGTGWLDIQVCALYSFFASERYSDAVSMYRNLVMFLQGNKGVPEASVLLALLRERFMHWFIVAKQLPLFVEKWGQENDFPLTEAVKVLTNSPFGVPSQNKRNAVLLMLSRLQIEEALHYVKANPECLKKEDGITLSSLPGVLRAYIATLPQLGGSRDHAEQQLRAATAA